MNEGSILDFSLRSQVFRRVDGSHHSLDCEEGGQVGSVRGDEDESEKPPNTSYYSTGNGSETRTQGQHAHLMFYILQ